MPRSLPARMPEAPSAATALVTTRYAIRVVTPLFGGGPIPRKTDPVTLIRVPSVRGQLRWWYRAAVGPRYRNAAAMLEAETAIFGSTETASTLRVRVKVTSPGGPVRKEDLDLREGDRLFPVFPRDVENVRIGVEFELSLEYPGSAKEDIETTLWAWTNFGGIGAKTRRGCGALYCKEFAPKAFKDRSNVALQNWSRRIPPDQAAVAWPHLHTLPQAMLSKPPAGDFPVLKAWRVGIEMLREFRRQGPEAHGIGSFDALGYAKGQKRMGSPVLLRPVVWADGKSAAPMMVPLRVGAEDSAEAVDAAVRFFRRHGYAEAGEY